MELVQLGEADVYVTPLAFGAWAIGGWMWGNAEDEESIGAIRAAYNAGITTIDTAPIYGFGKSEELVGKALKGISRDSYQLLTKFGMNWETSEGEFFFDSHDNQQNPIKIYKSASSKRIVEECEKSLKRLQTDYIDLYQIHWPDNTTPIHDTFEAVQKLISQGKVRAAGVCNYNVQQVDEALKAVKLASNQVPYSLINRGIEKEIVPHAINNNLGIIAYSPLQRGLLTGKIKPGHQFDKGDTREGNRFYTDENINKTNALLDEIAVIAAGYDVTLAQLAINWTTHQPGVSCVLTGARNEKQVNENVASLSFSLTDEENKKITEVANKYTF